MGELRACPFCGRDGYIYYTKDNGRFLCICDSCDATGPKAYDRDMARQRWDERAGDKPEVSITKDGIAEEAQWFRNDHRFHLYKDEDGATLTIYSMIMPLYMSYSNSSGRSIKELIEDVNNSELLRSRGWDQEEYGTPLDIDIT